MYRGRISIGELMNMPNRYFYALYHSAWKESVRKIKQQEEEQKRMEAEEKASRRNNKESSSKQLNTSNMSARQRVESMVNNRSSNGISLPNLSQDDLEDFIDDIS